jgi:hypothetical protein
VAGPIPDIPERFEFVVPIRRPLADRGDALALTAVGALAILAYGKGVLEAPAGSMARRGALTPQARADLPARDFAIPSERKYPINDYRHGQLALTYVASPSNIRYRYRVMLRSFLRYPSLINWWATTEAGEKEPLSAAFFRGKISEYRRKMRRQRGGQRQQTEAEIDALQVLAESAPRLRALAQRASGSAARVSQREPASPGCPTIVMPETPSPCPRYEHLYDLVRLRYPASSLPKIYPDSTTKTRGGYRVSTRDRGVVNLKITSTGTLEVA